MFYLNTKRFSCRLLKGNAGVVDQDIDSSVLLLHKISELRDGVLVTNVQDVELGLEAFLVKLRHGVQAPALISGGEVDIPTELLTQRPHDPEPDSLVRSCHHSYRHLDTVRVV